MFKNLQLPSVRLPEFGRKLRQEVRQFLAEELEKGTFTPQCDAWLGGFSPEFSLKLGAKGWLGHDLAEKVRRA